MMTSTASWHDGRRLVAPDKPQISSCRYRRAGMVATSAAAMGPVPHRCETVARRPIASVHLVRAARPRRSTSEDDPGSLFALGRRRDAAHAVPDVRGGTGSLQFPGCRLGRTSGRTRTGIPADGNDSLSVCSSIPDLCQDRPHAAGRTATTGVPGTDARTGTTACRAGRSFSRPTNTCACIFTNANYFAPSGHRLQVVLGPKDVASDANFIGLGKNDTASSVRIIVQPAGMAACDAVRPAPTTGPVAPTALTGITVRTRSRGLASLSTGVQLGLDAGMRSPVLPPGGTTGSAPVPRTRNDRRSPKAPAVTQQLRNVD